MLLPFLRLAPFSRSNTSSSSLILTVLNQYECKVRVCSASRFESEIRYPGVTMSNIPRVTFTCKL